MTIDGHPGDADPADIAQLGQRARHRASAAALCGWLLMAEPGPELAAELASVPSLEPLGNANAAIDFERILLREVPPYESIFCSDDGQRGGPIAARVTDAYAELDFHEHSDGTWRAAGPDHLGLELRAHAHLIALEAAAWEAGRVDQAADAVETQRRFLAEHLAVWAEIAIDALIEAADESAYTGLFEAIRELLHREIDLLRPAPILDEAAVAPDVERAVAMGPGRLARHLLSTERSGIWLSRRAIALGAGRLGFPWRPMDGRANLRSLLGAASDAGEIPELIEPWRELAAQRAATYAERREQQPGAGLLWAAWHLRANATGLLLDHLSESHLNADADAEVVVRIAGTDAVQAIALLEEAGYSVEHLD